MAWRAKSPINGTPAEDSRQRLVQDYL